MPTDKNASKLRSEPRQARATSRPATLSPQSPRRKAQSAPPQSPGTNPALTREIAERQETRAGPREAEQQANDLIRYAPTAIYEIDLRVPRFTRVNDAMCLMSGYTREELLATNPFDLMDEKSQQVFRERIRATLAGERVDESVEYRVRVKDGREAFALLRTRLLYEQGKPVGAFVIAHDITDRRQAEQAVRESEERYRTLFQNAMDAILVLDPSGPGRILSANPAACRLFGYEEQELLRLDREALLDTSDPHLAALMDQRGTAGPVITWLTYRRKDGTRFIGELHRTLLHDSAGKLRAISIVRDVTERQVAENALREEALKHRLALDAANLGTWDYDFGSQVSWDARTRRLFGVSPEIQVPPLMLDIVHPDDRSSVRQAVEKAIHPTSDGEYHAEYRVVWPDGSVHWISSNGQAYFAGQGAERHPVRFIGTVAEITQRKLAEERIQTLNRELERQKHELQAANSELESFSYSVSHDLRAPLGSIDGFTSMILKDHAAQLSPATADLLQLIHENAEKMSRLIEALLLLSRTSRQVLMRQVVEPRRIAEDVVKMLQPQCQGRHVEMVMGELRSCRADPVLLRQVYANLLSNAIKFTRNCASARIEIGAKIEQEQVIYFVKDNGVGFDMEQAGNLFGVFQRLHSEEEYEGTGIGLAIVQRIVRRHGGRVWAEGEEGKGAAFYFTLG